MNAHAECRSNHCGDCQEEGWKRGYEIGQRECNALRAQRDALMKTLEQAHTDIAALTIERDKIEDRLSIALDNVCAQRDMLVKAAERYVRRKGHRLDHDCDLCAAIATVKRGRNYDA